MNEQKKLNFWQWGHRVGLALVILFVICFAWYFIRKVDPELHLKLFKMAFFGFKKMNAVSFILGAIQIYIWGYIVTAICWLACGFKSSKKEN